MTEQNDARTPSTFAIVAAFAAVYVIWGSTYLAIRISVESLPPFMLAGTRFIVAGLILYGWIRLRGGAAATFRQWVNATVVGVLLLSAGNGSVVWAEQSVDSSIAALLVATVSFWMVLIEWARPGGTWPGAIVILGIALGLCGVAILAYPSSSEAALHVDPLGAAALIGAAFFWASGSIYSRHVDLPRSPWLSTAMQMLSGGAVLGLMSLYQSEWRTFDPSTVPVRAWLSLAYLVVFGSLVAFTAYVWLLQVSTPARASTYAYVNPAVAVLLGWAILSEPVSPRMFVAMACIIGAVVLITTQKRTRDRPHQARPSIEAPSTGAESSSAKAPCEASA